MVFEESEMVFQTDFKNAAPRDSKVCSEPGCCPSPERRDFIKVAGLGIASLALKGATPVMAGPFKDRTLSEDHFVPLDKKLNAEWVASLYEKGSSRVCKGSELSTIGMPVGGIGAGQLYLLGDGTLGCWHIFNELHFTR